MWTQGRPMPCGDRGTVGSSNRSSSAGHGSSSNGSRSRSSSSKGGSSSSNTSSTSGGKVSMKEQRAIDVKECEQDLAAGAQLPESHRQLRVGAHKRAREKHRKARSAGRKKRGRDQTRCNLCTTMEGRPWVRLTACLRCGKPPSVTDPRSKERRIVHVNRGPGGAAGGEPGATATPARRRESALQPQGAPRKRRAQETARSGGETVGAAAGNDAAAPAPEVNEGGGSGTDDGHCGGTGDSGKGSTWKRARAPGRATEFSDRGNKQEGDIIVDKPRESEDGQVRPTRKHLHAGEWLGSTLKTIHRAATLPPTGVSTEYGEGKSGSGEQDRGRDGDGGHGRGSDGDGNDGGVGHRGGKGGEAAVQRRGGELGKGEGGKQLQRPKRKRPGAMGKKTHGQKLAARAYTCNVSKAGREDTNKKTAEGPVGENEGGNGGGGRGSGKGSGSGDKNGGSGRAGKRVRGISTGGGMGRDEDGGAEDGDGGRTGDEDGGGANRGTPTAMDTSPVTSGTAAATAAMESMGGSTGSGGAGGGNGSGSGNGKKKKKRKQRTATQEAEYRQKIAKRRGAAR